MKFKFQNWMLMAIVVFGLGMWNWMLMAIVVFGLGMCVISCSDDDDNSGKSEEQKEQEAQQKASKFWDVVGQLVADDETEDYATKTFEPTIGNADPNDPQTRIVNTNDLKTAAKRFANLVGTTKVDENTQTYTYRDDDVGELIYTKGDGTTAWATVDVRIKQVPHLSRIIYRKAGEGENRSFSGKAYYRFGDVVKRTVQIKNTTKNPDNRQSVDEYWICVRPAFGPEGKEDSHWVCVNTVANNNVKYYRSSDKKDYWLPTNLKENREHMQNFAELLYAICNPTQWYNNANNFHTDGRLWGFDGVPIFHDFTKNNLCFHNDLFWKNVQEAWKTKEIAKNAMLLPSFSALSALVNSKDGIHLLYKGYSWWFSSSWNCELWEAIYTNGDTNEEKNMHHEKINDGIEHSTLLTAARWVIILLTTWGSSITTPISAGPSVTPKAKSLTRMAIVMWISQSTVSQKSIVTIQPIKQRQKNLVEMIKTDRKSQKLLTQILLTNIAASGILVMW